VRALGGEFAEISAFAPGEHLSGLEPVLLAGRFEAGGLFQAAYLPCRQDTYWRLTVMGSSSSAELIFPEGWPGRAQLSWRDATGTLREEAWEALNPWPPVVEAFEAALAGQEPSAMDPLADRSTNRAWPLLTWQTAIRSLELDDAARRSVERRRVSTLEYPEPTEEVGFKGTMTLLGCGLFWVILVLAILSRWFPWLGWTIAPVLVFFLGLQILRWLVRPARESEQRNSNKHESAGADPRIIG
jgi:hypothetical protein